MGFFELKIAHRYITGKKEKNKFISFISLMSMLGIILGVSTLIIVVSLLNGFKYETVNSVLEKTNHVKLLGVNTNAKEIIEYSKSHKDIKSIAANIIVPSAYIFENKYIDIYIAGLDIKNLENFKSFDDEKFLLRMLNENDFYVLLNDKYKGELNIGDNIVLFSPELNVTPVGSIPRSKTFKIVGFLNSKLMQQKGFEDNTVYMNASIAKKLVKMEENVLLWELKDFWKAQDFKQELSNKFDLGKNQFFITWDEVNKDLLSILKVEKLMTFIILMLIILVAAFNLVSSLVMTVNEKRGEIAMLRTMGCKRRSILTIFIIQGSFIGIIGTFIGVILGVLVSINITDIVNLVQIVFEIDFLNDFLNNIKISSVIMIKDIILIIFFSLLLSIIVTIYPSFSATKVHPAEALKNE